MVTLHDPRSAAARADPYPAYAAMRREDPLQHVASAGIWFLTRHADCVAVLRDPRFSARQGQGLRVRHDALPVSMLTTDPPEHTRLRRAVGPAFDAAAMRRARVWVAAAIDARLRPACEALAAGKEVDVASDVARPLAATVIARFLGLPADEHEHFEGWAQAVAVNLDPFADPAPADAARSAMGTLLDRVADHLHDRTTAPREDALGVLAQAHAAGRLSPEETLAAAGLLVVGGVEPLADMVTNAVAALLGQAPSGELGPDPPAGAPRGWRTAVDEFLRFDAPIPFAARTASEDVVLDGRRIRRGQSVVTLLGAANRDPARFAAPDAVALDRTPNPHLAFGAGPHTCLGAPLARLVGELLLEQTAGLLAGLRPGAAPAVRRTAVVPRGFTRLPVCRATTPG